MENPSSPIYKLETPFKIIGNLTIFSLQIGDFIKVGNLLGRVQEINSRSTVIKTMDKISIIVPNSRFLETDVINWNYDNPVSRLRIPIGVAYGSNIRKVRLALLEAVKSHADVLLTPRPQWDVSL